MNYRLVPELSSIAADPALVAPGTGRYLECAPADNRTPWLDPPEGRWSMPHDPFSLRTRQIVFRLTLVVGLSVIPRVATGQG